MVLQALKELGGAKLEVELTTFGGDYFMAAPIMNALRDYTGEKIVYLNGIVASAGTVIAMGFDRVIARPTSMFMIHNAWTVAMGNASDLLDAAGLLERIDAVLATNYAEKTGKTIEQIKDWMNAETYFFGQEAIDAGFVHSLSEGFVKNHIQWDISAYEKAPKVMIEGAIKGSDIAQKSISELQNKDAAKTDLSNYYRRLALIEKTA